jgi:hypothetical protein
MQDFILFRALAQSLLAGEPTVELLVDRCSRRLGKHWRRLRPLALRYLKQFGTPTRPRHRDVQRFLSNDTGVRRALLKYSHGLYVSELLTEPQQMQPTSAAAAWDIAAIQSPGDLAKWLGLDPEELRWFADLRRLGYKENSPEISGMRL